MANTAISHALQYVNVQKGAEAGIGLARAASRVDDGIGFLWRAIKEGFEVAKQQLPVGPIPAECSRGCSFCCHISVEVSEVEAFAIARVAKRRPGVREHLRQTAERIRGLNPEQRMRARIPCAFLGADGACTIYEDRPIACRGYSSASRAECAKGFEMVEHDIPYLLQHMVAGVSTHYVIGCTVRTMGHTPAGYELTASVLKVMDTPNAEKRWCAGENVLASDTQLQKR